MTPIPSSDVRVYVGNQLLGIATSWRVEPTPPAVIPQTWLRYLQGLRQQVHNGCRK